MSQLEYDKSSWEPAFLEHIGLKKDVLYYKSYIFKCLTRKLNNCYGRYELDNELIDIISKASNQNYIWKYASKTNLKYLLGYLKSDKIHTDDKKFIITFDQMGNDINQLEL